jgi:hypothetical protein
METGVNNLGVEIEVEDRLNNIQSHKEMDVAIHLQGML